MQDFEYQPPPRDYVDPELWASIEEASAKLKIHANSLARKCREELSKQLNAVMAFPPDGGHAQWYIFRKVDPRLRNATDIARHTFPLLMEYSERQRRTAWERMWAVNKFRELRSLNRNTMGQIERLVLLEAAEKYPHLKISRSTLYAWEARFQWPCELANLVDHRGGDQRHEGGFEAWQAFRQLFLSENQPTIRQCWEEVKNIAAEKGWSWCGYEACRRNLNKFIPPHDQIQSREREKYRTAMAPFTAQDPESWKAGERWIGDHKQLDVMAFLRPAMALLVPWRSHLIVSEERSFALDGVGFIAADEGDGISAGALGAEHQCFVGCVN
jgi:hypothetical protein